MRQVWVSEADMAIFETEIEAQRHEMSVWLRQQNETMIRLAEAGWTRDSGGLDLVEKTRDDLLFHLELGMKIRTGRARMAELEE